MSVQRIHKMQFRLSDQEKCDAESLKSNGFNISDICRKAIREEHLRLKSDLGIGKFKIGK